MIYLELLWSFMQIGLFSIGGGYAAMPLIQNQVVDLHPWLTIQQFADIMTIAEMTPGPIAINAATFVGIQVAGLPGALVATFGCVLPPFCIVLVLAWIYFRFRELGLVKGILAGIRPAVVAMIASAGLSLMILSFYGQQNLPGDPERCYCWVSHMPVMRQRRCKDIRMLDALRMELGTPEKPANRHATPGALTGAMMVGLAYDEKYMDPRQVGALGAQVVALTNGSPYSYLSGCVLSNLIAGILHDPDMPLKEHILQAVEAMQIQFAFHPQSEEVAKYFMQAVTLAGSTKDPHEVMEAFSCRDSHECTAAAIYASLVCGDDLDSAMILAINHSGRSSAVGALVGGILGAKLGAEALPEFYLETLECGDILQTLAADLAGGSPMSGLFNDDWDYKYIQGLPLVK